MAKFSYIALDAKGKEFNGVVDAKTQDEARTKLRKDGLFPTSVDVVLNKKKKKKKKRSAPGKPGAKKKGSEINITMPAMLVRVNAKQKMSFTRQLSILINSGLPLLRSLQVVLRQEKNQKLRQAIEEMADAIQSGSTLAESVAHHPKVFDRLYVNMVKAGEVGGILDQILARLAEFMEKSEAIKAKVKGAMVYPIVVLVMALGIVGFMMVFIIPRFTTIFEDLLEGEPLPPLTLFVMNVSDGFTTKGPFVLIFVIALVIFIKIVGKNRTGRLVLDGIKLKVPLFGALTRKSSIARFARTLGTLMTAGVPVLQALMIVRDTSGNAVLSKAAMNIHDAVKEGENMTPPLEASGVFPPLVVSMVEVGEETGALPEMLIKVADVYDQEVDTAVDALTSIIEPILIIFLAVVVGTIVIALFMPLISIITNLN